ncbi:MAG: DUF2934 domain-containing protein [Candidatus Omnitrophica bacterium]|nr:DUF2934 domain-containing protein [Candidatus Omnitrophota bacterium]
MATRVLARKQTTNSETSEEFRAEVAKVAYELFQKRGESHGSDFDDWLRAEQIVRQRWQLR